MMLPVAMSVVKLVESQAGASWAPKARRGFAVALLLGVAYGASIGGMATPIGTPPNLFLISFASIQLGREISFAQWMTMALPLCAAFFPSTWWLLTRALFPVPASPIEGGRELVRDELAKLGPPSRPERIVLVVFLTACTLWITRPLLTDLEIAGFRPFGGLGDAGVAMLAAMVLFVSPSGRGGFTLDWETAVRLPWGILLLFGGGLSLAAAISANGVGEWLGAQSAALAGFPELLSMIAVVTGMVFLTELTSNTASAAALVPVFAAAATGLGASPLLLAVAATLSASCAFMLPVATPPNAVVFGSGHVSIRDMVRAGFWLNMISIIAITTLMFWVAAPVLGE
jgi:sodium-dependent dicarboxylate transporter 2/3/5